MVVGSESMRHINNRTKLLKSSKKIFTPAVSPRHTHTQLGLDILTLRICNINEGKNLNRLAHHTIMPDPQNISSTNRLTIQNF